MKLIGWMHIYEIPWQVFVWAPNGTQLTIIKACQPLFRLILQIQRVSQFQLNLAQSIIGFKFVKMKGHALFKGEVIK